MQYCKGKASMDLPHLRMIMDREPTVNMKKPVPKEVPSSVKRLQKPFQVNMDAMKQMRVKVLLINQNINGFLIGLLFTLLWTLAVIT